MKKMLFILFIPFVLACGVSVSTPTPASVDKKLHANTTAPTLLAVPTLTEYPASTYRVTVTANTLRIRGAPSTGSEEIGILKKGDVVTVGILVVNNHPDCHQWYPVNGGGWICADYVEIIIK